MNAESVVLDFCGAFARQDLEELLGFFADDAVYHNIPLEPAVGLDAIRATLGIFVVPGSEAKFEIRSVASNGNTVLTERVDHLSIGGKPVVVPVMGAFEVNADGKISAWRDYFDMAQVAQQTG